MRQSRQGVVLQGRCHSCGGPLSIPVMATNDTLWSQSLPTALCWHCVALALARMAIVRHGDLGDPRSYSQPGHEQRMAAHAARVSREDDHTARRVPLVRRCRICGARADDGDARPLVGGGRICGGCRAAAERAGLLGGKLGSRLLLMRGALRRLRAPA